jgi:hypothetical protein
VDGAIGVVGGGNLDFDPMEAQQYVAWRRARICRAEITPALIARAFEPAPVHAPEALD